MTLNLTAVLRVEGQAAKAELAAATTAVQKLGTETERQAASQRANTTATNAATAATGRAAQANRTFAVSQGQAAAATGNLVANFNDIGVMLAAGQNPLQLAIQQGTQITQVIGPMGAAGAVELLKTAFFQMLNPVNLFTIAAIAAGAASIQWMTGAGSETLTFSDSVAELTDRADAYVAAAERARASTAELREEFGSAALAAGQMFADIADRELRELLRQNQEASQNLQSELGVFEGPQFGTGNQKNLADLFDLSIWSRDARIEINTVLNAFKTLDGAGTLEEQLAAAEALRVAFIDAAMASGEISAAEDAILAPLDAMIQKLMAARAEQDGTRDGFVSMATEAELLNTTIDVMSGNLARMAGVSISGIFAEAQGPANALFGTVGGIVSEMSKIARFRTAQMNLAADGLVYSGRGSDPRTSNQKGYGEFVYTGPPLDANNNPIIRGATGAGAGGGGGGAAAEADALQKLIASLEGEIAALRVQDPLQQELLRHREALTGATDAERAKVEELIATRDREKAAVEGLRSAAQMGGNALIDALMGAEDAGRRLIETLLQAGLQAALLGEGPLAGLFGGGEGGGFLGMLLGSISPVKKASGGMITGPGTATSDSIPAMLSNGEFVVNARATSRNRGLLEAINSGGRILGLAEGGMVGAARQAPGAGGGQRPMVQIINQSAEPIREEQGNGPDAEGTVTLIVGRAMGQGRFDRQQRTRFGLTPKVTAR